MYIKTLAKLQDDGQDMFSFHAGGGLDSVPKLVCLVFFFFFLLPMALNILLKRISAMEVKNSFNILMGVL